MAKPNLKLVDFSDPESAVEIKHETKKPRIPWHSEVKKTWSRPRAPVSPLLAEHMVKEREKGVTHDRAEFMAKFSASAKEKKRISRMGEVCVQCGYRAVFCRCENKA